MTKRREKRQKDGGKGVISMEKFERKRRRNRRGRKKKKGKRRRNGKKTLTLMWPVSQALPSGTLKGIGMPAMIPWTTVLTAVDAD